MLVKQNTDFFSREKQRIGIFYNQPKNQLKIKHNYFFRNPFLRNIAEPKILCDENFFISLSILSLLFCSSALLSLLMLQSEIHYNCTFYQKKIIIFFFLVF